jgi:hypothetical protein
VKVTPATPASGVLICRSVTIHADGARLADDLERELRRVLGLEFRGRLADRHGR